MERKCTLTLAPELHAGIRGGGKRWFPSEGLTHSATPWLKPSRKQTFLKATYKQVTSFKWIKVFLLRKRWTHRFAIPYENRRTLQLSSTDKSRPTCRKQERRWQFSFSVQHVCSKILILRTLNIFSIYFARSTQYFRNTFFPHVLDRTWNQNQSARWAAMSSNGTSRDHRKTFMPDFSIKSPTDNLCVDARITNCDKVCSFHCAVIPNKTDPSLPEQEVNNKRLRQHQSYFTMGL